MFQIELIEIIRVVSKKISGNLQCKRVYNGSLKHVDRKFEPQKIIQYPCLKRQIPESLSKIFI